VSALRAEVVLCEAAVESPGSCSPPRLQRQLVHEDATFGPPTQGAGDEIGGWAGDEAAEMPELTVS